MILHRSFFPEPVPKTLVCFDCTNKAARTRTLPEGVYQRKGLGGVGIQLYRVVGSCLGDVEEPMGFGRTLADAIADCKKKGNWPV